MSDTASTLTPPRPLRADARRNYDNLIAAAFEVFSERGSDASLEEVARRAGVGVGTLYRHFPTRDALIEAFLAEYLTNIRSELDAFRDQPLDATIFATLLRRYFTFSRRFGGVVGEQMAKTADTSSPAMTCSFVVKQGFQELFARAEADGIVRDASAWKDVLKILSGSAMALRANYGGLSAAQIEESAESMFRIVLSGVLAPGVAIPQDA